MKLFFGRFFRLFEVMILVCLNVFFLRVNIFFVFLNLFLSRRFLKLVIEILNIGVYCEVFVKEIKDGIF